MSVVQSAHSGYEAESEGSGGCVGVLHCQTSLADLVDRVKDVQ